MKTRTLQIALSLFLIVGMWACTPSAESPEEIKKQISEYKNQIGQIEGKIRDLEDKLATIEGASGSEFNVKVETLEIHPEHFEHHIRITGTVEPVKQAFISAEMNGQIEKIYVSEGQRVRKGQLLVQLDDNVLRNNIEEIETSLELAKKLFEKQKKLWEQNIGSEVEFLKAKNQKESAEKRIESLKAQLEMTKITAPFSGIIDEINQQEGELATPGFQIIQLVNLGSLYISADVPEDYLGSIKEGDMISVSFAAYPELNFQSKIIRTGNIIHPENRTFKIKVKINNKDEKIKSNMLAQLEMNDFSTDSAFVVPTLAILQDVNGKYVYLVGESGNQKIAEKRYVETGRSNETHTIVQKGLTQGEEVIVKGYNIVKNGMQVQIHSTIAGQK